MRKRNHNTKDITVHGADGDALGVVFRHDGYWYAMSHATQCQVGGGFATQEEAEAALSREGGAR